MPDREKPIKMVRTGEVIKKAEDLSGVIRVIHQIQATVNQAPKPAPGGTPPANQGGNNK